MSRRKVRPKKIAHPGTRTRQAAPAKAPRDQPAPILEQAAPAPVNSQPLSFLTNQGPVWPYALAILLLPLLVLWRHDDPLFSPLWQADPWFYLGYFRDLVNFKRELFPGFYYGSRLSWILPGYLAHSLFPPVVANAILHLTVHSIAALSLFLTLRWTIGLRGAYLTAMVFSLHPWLWCATGWDHVNGAAMAYYLLAMALLTRAALQPVRKGSLIFAGMALAGAVYAHLFLVALAPLLLLHYIGLTWTWHRARAIRLLPALCLWLGAGFVAFTVPLCVINYAFVDGNPWFWTPSIRTAHSVVQNYLWSEGIWSDEKLVPWLWFIVVGAVTAIFLLPTSLRRGTKGFHFTGLLFSGQLLLAASLMAYLQSRGITLLGHYYYACYLLPFVFLVIAASFWPAVEKMCLRTYVATCCTATLLFGALWYDPAAHPIPQWLVPEWAEILLGGFILAVAFVRRQRQSGTFLAIAGLAIFTSVVYTGSYRFVKLHGTREEYARIMKARQHIEDRRNGAEIRFWYDKQEPSFNQQPASFEYGALNYSYLAEFSRIGEGFPHGCNMPVEPGTLVVVSSLKEHTPELARSTLADCWRPLGIRPSIEAVEVVQRPGQPYTMVMLRAVPDISSRPEDLFKTIALERVRLGDIKASLKQGPEGLLVTTLPDFGAFAGRVTLGIDASIKAALAVHVRARVLQGKVAFGILTADNKAFLIERSAKPSAGTVELSLPLPSPPVTGDLIISNVAVDNIVSKALVERIEVWKAP